MQIDFVTEHRQFDGRLQVINAFKIGTPIKGSLKFALKTGFDPRCYLHDFRCLCKDCDTCSIAFLQGVKVIRLREDERLVGVQRVAEQDADSVVGEDGDDALAADTVAPTDADSAGEAGDSPVAE